jgi:hypothetical protein
VTYEFTVNPSSTNAQGSFILTVDDPVTAETLFPVASLTSCIVQYAPCQSVELAFTGSDNFIVFRQSDVGSYYYFASNAFTTNGSYEEAYHEATLVVSGIPEGWSPAPVPEPASWALMIGGLGLAGATLRRRAAVARFIMA